MIKGKLSIYTRVSAFFFLIHSLCAESWSNWLGPNYNGVVADTLSVPNKLFVLDKLWEISVGVGWSSPLVFGKKVFLHDRVNSNENLTAYNISSGEVLWRFSSYSSYRDDFGMENGPRSTPSISQGIIITHSPDGIVHAISVEDGKLKWKVDLLEKFGSPKGFFGRCSSPLVVGDKVILDVGGVNAGLTALSLFSGETVWKSKPYGNDYASVVPLKTDNMDMVVAFMRQGLVIVDAKDGEEVYFDRFQSPINASVNAASPLVLQNGVFLSSCYEVGSGYWEFSREGGRIQFTNKWKKNEVLDCHYSTPVEHENFLFGFHGRQERGSSLRCMRLSDGKVMWTAPPIGTGHLIRVGKSGLCLTEKGEFFIFDLNPLEFKPVLREQVLGSGRAHFAYSQGLVFARDKRRLVCLDLTILSSKSAK